MLIITPLTLLLTFPRVVAALWLTALVLLALARVGGLPVPVPPWLDPRTVTWLARLKAARLHREARVVGTAAMEWTE